MSHKNCSIVRDFYEAVEHGDKATILDILDPNLEWVDPEVPELWFSGTHLGAEAAYRTVIEPTADRLDHFHIQLDTVLDAEDHVVATGRFRGQVKDSGIDLNAPFAHIFTFRHDRIVRFEGHTDTVAWIRAFFPEWSPGVVVQGQATG
jgi:hypothetical protein